MAGTPELAVSVIRKVAAVLKELSMSGSTVHLDVCLEIRMIIAYLETLTCLLGSAGAVLEDVGLVWKNCRTFNAEGSDIHAMADEAEAHFVQLWAKKELPFEPADLSKSSSEPRKHASVHLLTGTSLMRTYTHTVLCLYAMSMSGACIIYSMPQSGQLTGLVREIV